MFGVRLQIVLAGVGPAVGSEVPPGTTEVTSASVCKSREKPKVLRPTSRKGPRPSLGTRGRCGGEKGARAEEVVEEEVK